jgi:hypothetical protein
MAKALAYYITVIITAVKSFMVQDTKANDIKGFLRHLGRGQIS